MTPLLTRRSTTTTTTRYFFIFFILFLKNLLISYAKYDNNILITGGTGFLGRYLTSQFCNRQYKVTIVDNLSSDHSISPQYWSSNLDCPFENLEFFEMDCKDFFKDKRSYRSWDIFIHLAGVNKVNNHYDQLKYSLQVTGECFLLFLFLLLLAADVAHHLVSNFGIFLLFFFLFFIVVVKHLVHIVVVVVVVVVFFVIDDDDDDDNDDGCWYNNILCIINILIILLFFV